MSKRTSENVVSLDEYGRQRNGFGPASATELLRECNRMVSERLSKFVASTLDKVDDALFACAEKAESNSQQTYYFDAMREVRLKRASVEERFQETFEQGFSSGIAKQEQNLEDPPRFGGSIQFNWDDETSSELDLVDHEQLEESLAVSNMATKLRSNCNTLLYALDQRMAVLLGDPEMVRWENPIGPTAICNAFKSSSEVIETGIDIRLIILKLFDQHALSEIRSLYQSLNKFLLDQGVLPEIRTKFRKNPNRATVQHSVPQSDSAPQDIGEQSAATTSSGIPLIDGASTNNQAAGVALVNTLTLLQRGHIGLINASHAAGHAIDLDAEDIDSGTVNVLSNLRQAGIANDLGKSGDMTLGIVSMLFDYILDDRNIHDSMRALIGRLQIPILKVALLDRNFFARKIHPARRLLNSLASIAIGWNEEDLSHEPAYRKVSSTVQRVLDDFDEDVSIFETMAQDLEHFIDQEEKQAQMRAQRSSKIAEGKERIEAAKESALDVVEKSTTSGDTTQLIQSFVSTHWKNFLFVTCAKHGKDSQEWKAALQTMNDLIWSVKPKLSVEDRKRLSNLQNGLLQRLRLGMAQLSITEDEQKNFLSELVRAHGRTASANVNEETKQTIPTPQENPGFTGKAVEAVLIGRQITLEEINRKPAPTKPAPAPATEDNYSFQVQHLREGRWVELTSQNGVAQRVKLSWISPITGTFLFTDRQGMRATELTPDEFVQEMRLKRARIINDAPLVDRAVSTVLKDYGKDKKQ